MDIYEQHKRAFPHTSAYAVLKNGNVVAKIAFKYPRDGSGRLYAYVHWIGLPMGRGHASGYGYDKHSAACADWAHKAKDPVDIVARLKNYDELGDYDMFRAALMRNNGRYWNDQLREDGFVVVGVV